MAMLAAYDEGNFELNESYREIRTYLSINKNIKCLISVFFFNVTICKTKNLHTLTYIQYMKAQ